jgi:hypothetical protein
MARISSEAVFWFQMWPSINTIKDVRQTRWSCVVRANSKLVLKRAIVAGSM